MSGHFCEYGKQLVDFFHRYGGGRKTCAGTDAHEAGLRYAAGCEGALSGFLEPSQDSRMGLLVFPNDAEKNIEVKEVGLQISSASSLRMSSSGIIGPRGTSKTGMP